MCETMFKSHDNTAILSKGLELMWTFFKICGAEWAAGWQVCIINFCLSLSMPPLYSGRK